MSKFYRARKPSPRSVAVVGQGEVARSQPVEHAESRHAAVDGVTALDSDHARDFALSKRLPYLCFKAFAIQEICVLFISL